MTYFWSLYAVSYRNSAEARSFELEYRSNSHEDPPIPLGIACFDGAVLVPTQTGGQLLSVPDSFLPLVKDTAARNCKTSAASYQTSAASIHALRTLIQFIG
jgi:hypothetical protein